MKTEIKAMWEALAAYQPQADANGHGDTWAVMCSEKTSAAAVAACGAADAVVAAYDADTNAAEAASCAVVAAYAYDADTNAARAATAEAVSHTAIASNWAKFAIARINKARGTPQAQQEPVAIHQVFIDGGWRDKEDSELWQYSPEFWQRRTLHTTPQEPKENQS